MNTNILTFQKTDEKFGGLSNKSDDYPIMINGYRAFSSEHLFHALKFPSNPEIQKEILARPTPNSARMCANKKDYRKLIRPDWKDAQLEIMEFCIKAKLIWNWVKFGRILRSTEEKTIYELSSKKDQYWGVLPCDDGFIGENHLGKLLMKIRDEYLGECNENLRALTSPAHLNLRFMGEDIQTLDRRRHLTQSGTRTTERVNAIRP